MKPLEEAIKSSPHKELRPIQANALDKAYELLQEDKKFLVLELPPGVGKSVIGWILANAHKNAYFITIQKLLQDQYINEMGDKMAILKGQNSYTCSAFPENDCENSACSVRPSIRQDHGMSCPYLEAVNEAQHHPFTLFNIHSFYYQFRYGSFKSLDPNDKIRDLMIVDEAHLLENTFMSLVEVSLIEGNYISTFPNHSFTKDYTPFLKNLKSQLSSSISKFNSDMKSNSSLVDPADVKKMVKISRLVNKLALLLNDMESGNEWVHQFDTLGAKKKLVFKPLFVERFIQQYLYNEADKIILMSATIGNFDQFCKRSGIDKNEAAIIRGPSPFPIKNRPIYYQGSGSMGRKSFEKNFPKLIKQLEHILEMHEDEKGVVQAHSEWLANKILDKLSDKFSDRLTAKKGDVFGMLEEHEKKANSVIVAAGISTGLDLKDNLARFQVIVKVPYPSLGDEQMKRRFEISQDYYFYITALTLMQTYGRGIRSKDDHASTYILDSDFGRFKHFNKHMLSKWFLEAIE